ncbi:squalene monooxygenase SE1-like [Cornus florida]|uniref:squalene monooxygenase SE1-like n=1 Tax=Cornus florida TaxID=4283 RepID=UPI00289786F6|nr:squalene monooxygenase SE1-like [Cornus florida]
MMILGMNFFVSLLGFILLHILRDRSKRNRQKKATSSTAFEIRGNNREFCPDKSDVIIVGAGVAGAALAHTLGKDGRQVHVIERDLTEPDRIVGELLQPGGYLKLIELGLEDCVEEIDAQPVFGYALFKDGRSTKLSYPLDKFHSDVAGRSFHNGHFIQRMREKAATLPNVRLEQGIVTSLMEENGAVNMIWRLYQIPPEVHDAFIAAIDKGNIKTMPNRSMPAAPLPTPGALLMGDAFNMSHPLTGGGMTVALSDIVVLRNLLKPLHDLSDADSLCTYLESFYTLRMPVASTINTLAGALYKVFYASSDQASKEMRQACFDYLSLGGVCSTGPVALLSGLNPRPLSLVLHFFFVALYGVGRLLLPFPSPKSMYIGARLILGASGIIFPIIEAEGVRQVFFPATIPAYYRAPPLSGRMEELPKNM